MRHIIFLPLIFAYFFGVGLFAQSSDTEGYLLLKNGQLVKGQLNIEGQKIWVTKKSGSRMAFDAQRVIATTKNLSEIYWAKYSQLSATDTKGHIALYRWCLENDLLTEAKNELDVIHFLAIDTRKLMQLQDSLVAKLEHQRKKILAEATAMVSLPQFGPELPGGLSKTDELVRPASFDSDLEQRHQDALKRTQHSEKLRSITKQLPDYSVVMFKRKIEPILIRSCYTAKCHDKSFAELPLTTAGKGVRIPKRMSQENLYQVLKHTNVNQPLESKLLSAAVLPHAGLEKPIVKIQSQQFQFLRAWLISISSKPYNFHPIPQSFLDSDLFVTTRQSKQPTEETLDLTDKENAQPDSSSTPAKAAMPESFDPIPKKNSPDEMPTSASDPENAKMEENELTKPTDPFDPEKFNKNFRKQDEMKTGG